VDESRLAKALAGLLGPILAAELASDYVNIRHDHATKTLGRASPGKFVEGFVQALQQIAHGKHDTHPNVDHYLDKRAEQETALPEGLRICAARIARSIYTLRNKRNIAHKGEVDPNTFDLAFIHQAAAWIVAELIRSGSGLSMEEAGALVELIQVPVGTIVEEIDGIRIVHGKLTIREELMILLHSHYPERASLADIDASMSGRSASAVRNVLRGLRDTKLAHGEGQNGYRLTQPGYAAAQAVIQNLAQ
jgi:hypothetical protein